MRAYRVATQYALLEMTKNRLAMTLLAGFIPLWITMARFVITKELIGFRLGSTGEFLHAGGEKITMISGCLNAVTLLTGFVMFQASSHTEERDPAQVDHDEVRRGVDAGKQDGGDLVDGARIEISGEADHRCVRTGAADAGHAPRGRAHPGAACGLGRCRTVHGFRSRGAH
jgi:hypothetical protein